MLDFFPPKSVMMTRNNFLRRLKLQEKEFSPESLNGIYHHHPAARGGKIHSSRVATTQKWSFERNLILARSLRGRNNGNLSRKTLFLAREWNEGYTWPNLSGVSNLLSETRPICIQGGISGRQKCCKKNWGAVSRHKNVGQFRTIFSNPTTTSYQRLRFNKTATISSNGSSMNQ